MDVDKRKKEVQLSQMDKVCKRSDAKTMSVISGVEELEKGFFELDQPLDTYISLNGSNGRDRTFVRWNDLVDLLAHPEARLLPIPEFMDKQG